MLAISGLQRALRKRKEFIAAKESARVRLAHRSARSVRCTDIKAAAAVPRRSDSGEFVGTVLDHFVLVRSDLILVFVRMRARRRRRRRLM